MKNVCLNRYKLKIQNIDWREFYNSNDINIINDIFVQKVGDILEQEAPLKNYQNRKNYRNWLNPEIKAQMESRNMKRELARSTGLDTHWRDYRRARNMCTKLFKKVKIEHYTRLFQKNLIQKMTQKTFSA